MHTDQVGSRHVLGRGGQQALEVQTTVDVEGVRTMPFHGVDELVDDPGGGPVVEGQRGVHVDGTVLGVHLDTGPARLELCTGRVRRLARQPGLVLEEESDSPMPVPVGPDPDHGAE